MLVNLFLGLLAVFAASLALTARHSLRRERAALAEARSASRRKDVFLATLSHELRGPLTAVIGWLELGVRTTDDPATLRRSLDIALRNARHQARIIEDLLDLSRIVSGKLLVERRPLRLWRVAREALEACQPVAQERGVALRCSASEAVAIDGDRERMRQVLCNLIGNAIKFNHAQGWVELTLDTAGERARLTVADNGAGIAPEALPHIFEPFWQAEAGEARRAGLGLGLTIVRHIVEQHGGCVSVESEGPGKGARFTVELPVLQDRLR